MTRLSDLKWRPAYAYLPGQTERHPETLFDEIKTPARDAILTSFVKQNFDYAYLLGRILWESRGV